MRRGKSIDKGIKNIYYLNFERKDVYDKLEDTNVYQYAQGKVKEYLEKQYQNIQESLKIDKEKIEEMILRDAWYHIYENICLLDAYYNAHDNAKSIKKEKEYDDDFDVENAGLISLKDYVGKNVEKNQQRKYKDKIKKGTDFINYSGRYRIPKTCNVFFEYYSTMDELKGKHYLRTDYLDIVKYLYDGNFKKTDIRSKIRRYEIWDIDKTWIPEISKLYTQIQNGKNKIFEYQLAERMFKFRTALDIYNTSNSGDMIYYIQPFTVFGYSLCMHFIMDNYDKLSESDEKLNILSALFFNAISYTIKNTIETILNNVWHSYTNKDKCSMISIIKSNADENKDALNDHINFFSKYGCYDLYSSSEPDEKFMNIYIALLFNNKFINTSNICKFDGKFHKYDDEDCEENLYYDEDCDEYWIEDEEPYTDDLYKESHENRRNISGFYNSIYVEGDNDNEKDFCELYDAYEEFHIYYDFDFSDMLYLATDVEYEEFFI